MKDLKKRVWLILSDNPEAGTAGKVFHILVLILILLSVTALALESFDSIHHNMHEFFEWVEVVAVALFTLEYIAGFWTADLAFPNARHPHLRYFFSFMAMIELLAIFPFYLSLITNNRQLIDLMPFFQLLRLLHLFKLSEYIHPLHALGKSIRKIAPHLLLCVGICLCVLAIAGLVLYTAEGESRHEVFPNLLTTIWVTLASMSGLLDVPVHPVTHLGRFMAIIMALSAITAVAVPVGMIAAGYTREIREEEEKDWEFCPHCGKRLK